MANGVRSGRRRLLQRSDEPPAEVGFGPGAHLTALRLSSGLAGDSPEDPKLRVNPGHALVERQEIVVVT